MKVLRYFANGILQNYVVFRPQNCVFGRSKYLTTYEFRGKTQSQQKAAPPVPVEVCEHTRECRLINYELLDLDFNFFLIFVSFFVSEAAQIMLKQRGGDGAHRFMT